MKTGIAILTFGLALARGSLFAADGNEVLGVWNTADNKGQVEIFKQEGRFRARIIKLKEPNNPPGDKDAGRPKLDRENPRPELRNRPLVGLEILNGLNYAGKNLWEDGHVYDPENGKTYKCKMTLAATNRLEMRGFIGFSLLGRTTVWTR